MAPDGLQLRVVEDLFSLEREREGERARERECVCLGGERGCRGEGAEMLPER